MEIISENIPGYNNSNCCFTNVKRLVVDKGGSMVMGWLIKRLPEFISKVHHAVWRKPSGEMVDVTLQYDPDISQQLQGKYATLMETVEFEPDESATMVEGKTRQIQHQATAKKYEKFVEYLRRSESAILKGDNKTAYYWTIRADKERHHANNKKYNPRCPSIAKPNGKF